MHLVSYAQELEVEDIFTIGSSDQKNIAPSPASSTPPPSPPAGEPTLIDQLIAENMDVWERFLHNRFCEEGYKAATREFDDKFRAFSKQDYLYLISYTQFYALRELRDLATDTLAGLRRISDHMRRKCEYAESFFKGCIHNMGISENELQEERQSQPIAGYTAWLKFHAITDDVFSNYVRMIPCLYGWNQIAKRLQRCGNGIENTLFHIHWFATSIKDSSAVKLSTYLETNRHTYESSANRVKWSAGFRQACLFEIGFFEAAVRGELVA